MLEHEIQNAIRVEISARRLATLFRANVGNGWTGDKVEQRPDGSVLIQSARPFSTGLPKGFPDLFGLRSIEVGGRKFAAFVFLEVKQPGKRPTAAQQNMIEFLRGCGALGGVAHSPGEAVHLLRGE